MLNFDFYGMFDYDEAGGDTYQYTSEEFSSLIQGITGNGISANYLNQFEPTANGLDITIKSGAAFVNGRWGYNSAAKTISLSPTTSTTKRLDRIVIQLDVASRVIGLNTLTGTATTGTPTAPALNANQIPVCSVLVANGSTTTLTDERVFTYSAAEVQGQLNDIKAKMGNLAFLPLAGGNMTGDINFGERTNGCRWTTANGTKWHLRPYYGGNLFQLTLKPTDAPEYGAFAVNSNGVMSLSTPLAVDSGGTGANNAETARNNLGAAAANHSHSDYLPLSGGNMTGYINWGNTANAGLVWTTNNGTQICLRPYSPANTFQLTLKPSNGSEFSALNIDTEGNIDFAKALTVANGGTGASDAATARSNLGITLENIGAAAANHSHDYLPLAGGNMTGNINFGSATRGLAWTTEDGTAWSFRPHHEGNIFQLTFLPSGGTEHGAFNIDSSGVMSLYSPLPISSGGTGATDAAAARNNLGITPTNIGAATANHTHAYLPLAGGTITGDMTVQGAFHVSNSNSAGGYVKIWEDNEGGNIAIGSPDGHEIQFDAYDNMGMRCFAYDDNNVVRGFSFKRQNGDFCTDGDFYANGKRIADVQHGVIEVGTSGKTITFPHAFAGVPSVCANGNQQTSIRVEDITTTGCKLVSGMGNNTVQWIAVY